MLKKFQKSICLKFFAFLRASKFLTLYAPKFYTDNNGIKCEYHIWMHPLGLSLTVSRLAIWNSLFHSAGKTELFFYHFRILEFLLIWIRGLKDWALHEIVTLLYRTLALLLLGKTCNLLDDNQNEILSNRPDLQFSIKLLQFGKF